MVCYGIFWSGQYRAGAVGREGLVNQIPVLTPKYQLPSQQVAVLAPFYSLTLWPNNCSVAQNLFAM